MIVFMYPGQGSQRRGMGEAGSIIPRGSWWRRRPRSPTADVARLLLAADAEELTETRNSQLSTFVMSMVALDAVTRLEPRPPATPATASAIIRR